MLNIDKLNERASLFARRWDLMRLESAVRSATQSVHFWTNRENEIRQDKKSSFAYIHAIKKHRKKSEDDLRYATDKLARFVESNKIPYVLSA